MAAPLARTPAAARPASGATQPATRWWKDRRRLWVLLALVTLAGLVVAFLVTRDGGGERTGEDGTAGTTAVAGTTVAAPTTGAPTTVSPATVPATTVSPTTGVPTTEAPTTEAPTTVTATSTAPLPGARYVGLVYPSGAPPEGITEYAGSLLGDTGHSLAWMAGPEGSMFWLLRQAGTDDLGQPVAWEVMDVVVFPPLEQDVSDIVVTGTSACTVDGAAVAFVAAIFPNSGQEWLIAPYVAWWSDTTNSRFVDLPTATTTCRDEGWGA